MKKYLFLLLIGAASLTACGDDDDPVVPELNKLTKVSCYKDGASSPLFLIAYFSVLSSEFSFFSALCFFFLFSSYK